MGAKAKVIGQLWLYKFPAGVADSDTVDIQIIFVLCSPNLIFFCNICPNNTPLSIFCISISISFVVVINDALIV